MHNKTVLKSGLRVITEDIPHSQSVSVGLWVNTGSRYEKGHQAGICHFIEHLLFKGTESRTALQIAKEIDSVGGVLNAFTGREFTGIYSKVLQKDLPLALDILSDIFRHSLFHSKEVEKERKVILQEINLVEDTPDDYVHDLFNQAFWGSHPLGRSVLGTASTVNSITRDELSSYFLQGYTPARTLVTAAGRLEHQKVVDLVQTAFDGFSARANTGVAEPPSPSGKVILKSKALEQVHFCMGTTSLPHSHPSRFSCYVLNTILGGSMSSRLFQEIREERGLAYSVYSYLNAYLDAGSLAIYVGTSREALREVVCIILRECRRLVELPVDGEELQGTKEQLKGNLLLSMEHTENRMSRLGKNEIYYGRTLPVEEILASIDRVNVGDIQDIARQIFQPQFFALAMLGAIKDGESITPDIFQEELGLGPSQ